MADHQKIHPVHDVEAPQAPTVPLVPRNASKSHDGDPAEHYPPFRRTLPVKYSKPPKRRSCCCRCLCWTISLIILLIIAIGIAAAIIYLVFRPKLPDYSVNSLKITQFSLTNDMNLSATFNVNITATNPNKKIGIYYESGSSLSAWYMGQSLCEGSLPKFYQGYRNTTVMDVALTGQTQNATDLLTSLQAQQQTGSIPLNLRARVPVRIKLGSLKLMKVKFLVRCELTVDNLSAADNIRIRDSNCNFRFRL